MSSQEIFSTASDRLTGIACVRTPHLKRKKANSRIFTSGSFFMHLAVWSKLFQRAEALQAPEQAAVNLAMKRHFPGEAAALWQQWQRVKCKCESGNDSS